MIATTPNFIFAVAALLTSSTVTANQGNSTSSGCCKFTISSQGDFSCPAGQLADGQIRLNGTEDTATFCIDSEGGITDSKGFGCIVTDPPTTQFQCDRAATPNKHFAIDANNTLTYNGSAAFFACPATDTEYNIYVSPNFGQAKCFPITLQTDGCGAPKPQPSPSSSSCAASAGWVTQTVWATERVTLSATYTVTTTEYSFVSCTAAASSSSSAESVVAPSASSANVTRSCTRCHHQPTGNVSVATGSVTALPQASSTGVVGRRWVFWG